MHLRRHDLAWQTFPRTVTRSTPDSCQVPVWGSPLPPVRIVNTPFPVRKPSSRLTCERFCHSRPNATTLLSAGKVRRTSSPTAGSVSTSVILSQIAPAWAVAGLRCTPSVSYDAPLSPDPDARRQVHTPAFVLARPSDQVRTNVNDELTGTHSTPQIECTPTSHNRATPPSSRSPICRSAHLSAPIPLLESRNSPCVSHNRLTSSPRSNSRTSQPRGLRRWLRAVDWAGVLGWCSASFACGCGENNTVP